MSAQWHYQRGGTQKGPVSSAQLKQLASSGQLSPGDTVRKEGMSNWVPAEKIKGLFAAVPVATVTPPQPTATKTVIPADLSNAAESPAVPASAASFSCADCKYRRPRNVCGHPGSEFHGQRTEPTHGCSKFEANPAQARLTDARLAIIRAEPHEKIIALLEAAVQGGLPQDDEVQARRFLASQCRVLAVEHEESCLDGTLWSQAVKHLEYAVKVDSEQGYGVFQDRHAIAILPPFDARYASVADSIQQMNGTDAAIAYVVQKLSLFRSVPGDPMVFLLEKLGVLYYNEANDDERARLCMERILESASTMMKDQAREHLGFFDRVARSKAGRNKADMAMSLVLLGVCCGALTFVPGMIFGILAINDFKHGENQTGKGKAIGAFAIGTVFALLTLSFMCLVVLTPLRR